MYFPFLRGKQNEFLALIELKKLITTHGNILPIIEPINVDNYFKRLQKANIPFIIISNPFVGQLKDKDLVIRKDIIDKLEKTKNFFVAFQVNSKTTEKQLKAFIDSYQNYNICFIHQEMYKDLSEYTKNMRTHKNIHYHILNKEVINSGYIDEIKKHHDNIIILEDGFKKESRNADYSQSSYFSDLMFRYKKEGFKGYGDYLMIGAKYGSGFTPHAVALHYSHNDKTHISVKHFVSDRIVGNRDTAGKFLEALKKLIIFLDTTPHINTQGTIDYRDLHSRKHYPGLGVCKKISMKHHIELLSNIV